MAFLRYAPFRDKIYLFLGILGLEVLRCELHNEVNFISHNFIKTSFLYLKKMV